MIRCLFGAEHELGQRLGQHGLADTGGTKEDEGADRALGVLETGARAADGLGHRLDGLVLADDALVQRFFHLEQPLGFFTGDAVDRDAGPHRDDLGDILFGDVDLFLGLLVLELLLLIVDAVTQLALSIAQFGRALEFLSLDRRLPSHAAAMRDPPWHPSGVGGAAELCMRTREAASSIRSIALSGMKRSVT